MASSQDFFQNLKSEAKDFGSRVSNFFDDIVGAKDGEKMYPALADVLEQDKAVVYYIDLPGFDKSAVSVQIRDNQLVVKGERLRDHDGNVALHLSERPFGEFERSFSIPSGVEQEHVKAKFENGVLQITLPKEVMEESTDATEVSID